MQGVSCVLKHKAGRTTGGPKVDRRPTDAEIRQWNQEFEAAAKRPLEQRMKHAFIKT